MDSAEHSGTPPEKLTNDEMFACLGLFACVRTPESWIDCVCPEQSCMWSAESGTAIIFVSARFGWGLPSGE
jgi:hypothetical protein